MSSFVVVGMAVYRPGLTVGIRFILLLIALLLLGNISCWHYPFMVMMYISGIFFILTTIWLKYDTNSFFRYFAYKMYPNSNFDFNLVLKRSMHPGVTNHYSHNGIMLGNAFLVIFAFFLTSAGKRKHIVAIILNLIAMVICGKRAQVLFPMISIIITYLIFSEKNAKTIITTIVVILILIIIFLVLLNTNSIFQSYMTRYEDIDEDGNVLIRYRYWSIALEYFRKKPILGNGWLSFRGFNQNNQDAHNNYIQLLCDVGIIGTVIFCFFFLFNLIISYKNLSYVIKNKIGITRSEKLCCIFSFEYQVFFLLYGLTGNPIQLFPSIGPYIAACAMGIYYKNRYTSNNDYGIKLRNIA